MAVNSIRPTGTLNLFGGATAQPNVGQAPAAEERPQSKVWLNVGFMAKRTVTTGTGKAAVTEEIEELVSFPVNLAIDTMRKREYPWRPGKKLTPAQEELKDMIDASNLLLSMVQEAAGNMEPGTSQHMGGFHVVLQRLEDAVEEDAAAEPKEGSRTAQISALISGISGN